MLKKVISALREDSRVKTRSGKATVWVGPSERAQRLNAMLKPVWVPQVSLPTEVQPAAIQYLGDGQFDINGVVVAINGGMAIAVTNVTANLVDADSGVAVSLGQVPAHSKSQVHELKQAREMARNEWAKSAPADRVLVMEQIIDQFEASKELLATCIMFDSSKHLNDARAEVTRTLGFLRQEIQTYRQILIEDSKPKEIGGALVVANRSPVGSVDALGSNNYVFNEGIMMGLQSMLVGNVVAYKVPRNGQTTSLVASAMIQDALSTLSDKAWGAFVPVFGSGRELVPEMAKETPNGRRPISSDSVRYIGGEVGISTYYAAHPAPYLLKHPAVALGAKNPVILDGSIEATDLLKTVRESVKAGISNSGQRCTAGCPQFVSDAVFADFVRNVEVEIKAHYAPGMPWDDGAKILPPLDGEKNLREYQSLIADARDHGARILAPHGEFIQNGVQPPVVVVFESPEKAAEARVTSGEIFGPIMVVIQFSDDQAPEIGAYLSELPFGHQLSFYGEGDRLSAFAIDARDVDRIHINSAPSRGPDALRFGNRKKSGNDGPMSGIESVIRETETTVTYIKIPDRRFTAKL